jgi:hypothetical protein
LSAYPSLRVSGGTHTPRDKDRRAYEDTGVGEMARHKGIFRSGASLPGVISSQQR